MPAGQTLVAASKYEVQSLTPRNIVLYRKRTSAIVVLLGARQLLFRGLPSSFAGFHRQGRLRNLRIAANWSNKTECASIECTVLLIVHVSLRSIVT